MPKFSTPTIGLALLFCATLTTEASPQNHMILVPIPSGRPPSVTLHGSATVPLKILDGRPVIEVFINGKGPFRLAIETGTPLVMLSHQTIDRIRRGKSTFAKTGTVTADVMIGSAKFRGAALRENPFRFRGIDGVLGLSIFSDVQIDLDYLKNTFSVRTQTLPAPNGRTILPLTRIGPSLGAPVEFGKITHTAILDTLFFGALDVTPKFAASLHFVTPPAPVRSVIIGGSLSESRKIAVFKNAIGLGKYRLHCAEVGVRSLPSEFPQNPVLGAQILQHFDVSIDQRTMRAQFLRSGTAVMMGCLK